MSERAVHRQPGTDGLWTFVFIDMAIFVLIFLTFMIERMGRLDQFQESQLALDVTFGLANTLILLTSSWMVVEAVHAARREQPGPVRCYLSIALLLGVAFGVSKAIEYNAKFTHDIYPATNPFFSYYYFITVVHFLHVLAGMLCIYLYRRNARACRDSTRYVTGLENVGLFWHYVDVLWIFIFPLLYLVGRQ